MTAEQLEELLGKIRKGSIEPEEQLIALAPSLARRVIAAEKLADAVEYDLSCWPETMASTLRAALTAYREASPAQAPNNET